MDAQMKCKENHGQLVQPKTYVESEFLESFVTHMDAIRLDTEPATDSVWLKFRRGKKFSSLCCHTFGRMMLYGRIHPDEGCTKINASLKLFVTRKLKLTFDFNTITSVLHWKHKLLIYWSLLSVEMWWKNNKMFLVKTFFPPPELCGCYDECDQDLWNKLQKSIQRRNTSLPFSVWFPQSIFWFICKRVSIRESIFLASKPRNLKC